MLLAIVCAGFISSCYGELWVWRFFGFLASLRCFVCMEGASSASPPVTLVCLLPGLPPGWRSVGALNLHPLERMLGSS